MPGPAPFTDQNGVATIGTSEYSIIGQTTTAVPLSNTDPLKTVFVLDLAAMGSGDSFQIRVYEKVNAGTQRLLEEWIVTDAQTRLFVSPELWLVEGYDITLKKLAGTDRSIRFSFRVDSGWAESIVNMPSVTVGAISNDVITTLSIADGALTTDKFETHALNTLRGVQFYGTAEGGAGSIITLEDSATGAPDATNDMIVGMTVVLTASGVGADELDTPLENAKQCRTIIAYDAVSRDATVDRPWTVNPDEFTGYEILAAPTTLRATAYGNTLDVSSGGEAGLDWANIGSPTTTQGLSGTTVKTATDVETDTQDIQSRLPAALVSGRIDASVGAIAADAITAAAIAADAGTEIATAVWAAVIEAGAANFTAGQILMICSAVLAGKASGFDTDTRIYRDLNDDFDRVTATVDTTGRLTVTYNLTP